MWSIIPSNFEEPIAFLHEAAIWRESALYLEFSNPFNRGSTNLRDH